MSGSAVGGSGESPASLLQSLSTCDAILEPTAGATLAAYLSAGGAPKKAVKAIADGYKGRTEMINLLAHWTDIAAGAHTNAATEAAAGMTLAPVAAASSSSSSAGAGLLTRLVQRAVVRRFDGGVADGVLEQSQPAWLESLVASPAWSGVFPELLEKSPTSLFLRLCVGLVAEHQLDAQAASATNRHAKRETGDNDDDTRGEGTNDQRQYHGGSIVTASVRASVLADFPQFHSLVQSILLALLDRAMEMAAGGDQAAHVTRVKQEGDLAARLQYMSFDTLVSDLQRLAATSEYAYLYVQRVLQGVQASAPRELTFLFHRIEQDVRQYASFPPVAAVLVGSSATSGGGNGGEVKNPAAFPLDLYLLGLKEEWLDVFTALHALHRTDQLSMLDLHRMYTRYNVDGDAAPPVAAIRDKKLIRTLLQALFAPPANSTLFADTSSGGNGGAVPSRDKYIYLLAYACSVRDERACNIRLQHHLAAVDPPASSVEFTSATAAMVSGPVDRSSFDAIRSSLTKLHDLTRSSQWGLRPNALLRLIHQNLDVPVVAVAAVTWIGCQLTDSAYFDTTYSSHLTPLFLALLGEMSNRHPLLRATIFHTGKRAFHVNSGMDALAGIGVKKLLLTLLIHLAHVGLAGPVIGMVADEVPKGMDHSLIRHFVVQLLHTTAPPYSRLFLTGVLGLLALPQTHKALQTMLVAYVKLEAQAAKALQDPAVGGAQGQAGAAAQLLAAAHVQPNTKAALRLLAAAQLHGQLPQSSPSPPPAAPSAPDGASSDEPSRKKLKSESGSAVASEPVELSQQDRLVHKLLHPPIRPPKPLAQVGAGHDASDSAVLDFCALLRERPDLLTHSSTTRGLVVNEENVLQALDDAMTDGEAAPLPGSEIADYIRTIDSYLALKDQ